MPLESLAQAMNRISAEVRGGPLSGLRMAEGGAVYDPMGNVSVPPSEGFEPSPAYENIADALARTGAAVGRPTVGALETAARVYSEKSREAAAENEALRQQAMRNMQGELGYAGMPLGAGQMLLSQLGTATLPLTAAAKTAGYAATQATGNPRFGENVEMLSGFVDPSHVGMLKAAVPMAGAAAARQAVQTARELSPLGLYSHGAEAALSMPQAKGSPEQMLAYLQNKGGVKPGELESARAAFADRPSVTREEIAQHMREQMPALEERVLRESAPEYPHTTREEWLAAIRDAERRGDEAEVSRLNNAWADQREGFRPQGSPKYQEYTLPGGENYREVLLKSPSKYSELRAELEAAQQDKTEALRAYNNAQPGSDAERLYKSVSAAQDRVNEARQKIQDIKGETFKSSHWGDPNVLAHIRMADRTGPNGEKILHVEELQSDWGQQGRKEGFMDQRAIDAWRQKYADAVSEMNAARENRMALADMIAPEPSASDPRYIELLRERQQRLLSDPDYIAAVERQRAADTVFRDMSPEPKRGTVPVGPYVTSTEGWTDLALKRVLREAAEGGYDRVVFTPGAEQAKRYDLANHVERIAYDPEEKTLSFVKKGEGGWHNYDGEVEPEQLAGIIGKDAAEKLLSTEPSKLSGIHNLETEGLTFGGEGMKAYYDKMVPKRLQELVRKHDKAAKVGKTDVLLPPEAGERGSNNPPIETMGITITPQMRESILRGQPHMAEGGEVKKKTIEDVVEQAPTKEETLKLAAEHGLHRPQIAAILRQNDPRLSPERATARAREIMAGDTQALRGILSDKLMAELRHMLKGARP